MATPKFPGNLAMVASAIRLDIERFLDPDGKLEECNRVLTQLIRLSRQFPLIHMNGKASNTSYTFILDNVQRRNAPSFPNLDTLAGREQHRR